MTDSSLYTPEQELDAHLRMMQWFESQRINGKELFTHGELMQGFMWQGHRIRLTHQTQGIWKPSEFKAALTFKTAAPQISRKAPYDDYVDEDGLLRYHFASSSGKTWTNDAMIEAAHRQYPLAWLVGTKPGKQLYYYVRFPAFIHEVDHTNHQFIISIGDALNIPTPPTNLVGRKEIDRRYVSRWTKARLHQHDFREQVLGAYDITCAICDMPHAQLIEAAHIIPDSMESGVPEVSNGIALCRVHHTAYDRHLLGIDVGYRIHVATRAIKLEESRHTDTLTSLRGKTLTHVPNHKILRPRESNLEQHFNDFLSVEESAS